LKPSQLRNNGVNHHHPLSKLHSIRPEFDAWNGPYVKNKLKKYTFLTAEWFSVSLRNLAFSSFIERFSSINVSTFAFRSQHSCSTWNLWRQTRKYLYRAYEKTISYLRDTLEVLKWDFFKRRFLRDVFLKTCHSVKTSSRLLNCGKTPLKRARRIVY
jgi:hypothetical protein